VACSRFADDRAVLGAGDRVGGDQGTGAAEPGMGRLVDGEGEFPVEEARGVQVVSEPARGG
jgi:hypothetical protein